MKVDIIATVQFLTPEQGSRRSGPIVSEFFKCPFVFEDSWNDCGIYLDKLAPIFPGTKVKVSMEFVRPDRVKPHLKPGSQFQLWESGIIAEGVVEQIFPD